MPSFPSVDEQLKLIARGIEKIVPAEELRKKLQHSRDTGTPLRIKYGIDPTGIDVHLGHTVPLRKMRQFQELGHQAVIIIGNYTALVGDPSGRDEARSKRLTEADVETNATTYLTQVGKVVDMSRAEVHRNGDWFGKMSFADVLTLCGRVTVAQLLTREDFAKRYREEKAIFLHECLYPVMQAFDSVCIAADIELGGTEQLYSFMLARELQADSVALDLAKRRMKSIRESVRRKLKSSELGVPEQRQLKSEESAASALMSRLSTNARLNQQIAVMSPILVGLDGVRRMGKSLGNYIGISEAPYEMMKKIMQIPDDVMKTYFELLTEIPLDHVDRLLSGHPKEAKIRLAREIISQYHPDSEPVTVNRSLYAEPGAYDIVGGEAKLIVSRQAIEAAARWQSEIGGEGLPTDIPEVILSRDMVQNGTLTALKLLTSLNLCTSNGEARRLIDGGGAKLGEDKTTITSHDQAIQVTDGLLVWAGKKKYCRVRL